MYPPPATTAALPTSQYQLFANHEGCWEAGVVVFEGSDSAIGANAAGGEGSDRGCEVATDSIVTVSVERCGVEDSEEGGGAGDSVTVLIEGCLVATFWGSMRKN